jgi:hypothetical protein
MKKLFLIFTLLVGNVTFSQNEYEEEDEKQKFTENFALTVGFLNGGGSILGGDLEFRIHKRFSGQLGLGLTSFGGGLNLHFKEDLHSNFISLQYYNQGFGQNHIQSLIGASYNFRFFSFLGGSIGFGNKVMEGPAYTNLPSQYRVNTMLIYSLGIYKVF